MNFELIKDNNPQFDSPTKEYSYIGYFNIDDKRYELYDDDYGQTYVIEYFDKENNKQEICCGAYCNYMSTLEYIIGKN